MKEEPANSQSKWINIDGGIQYLGETAMVEVICNNLDDDQASKDLDDIWCTRLARQPPPQFYC